MNDTTSGADLAAKKLPELQAMAAERGIKGARRLRKGETALNAKLLKGFWAGFRIGYGLDMTVYSC